MEEKTLTEKESKKIAELLSRAIKNKEHPHPADLQRRESQGVLLRLPGLQD